MAEIPVEKKGGIPWWIWLLLALVVAALIWWAVAASDDDSEVPVVADTTMVEETTEVTAPEMGALTDGMAIYGPGVVIAQLIGRDVDLNNVAVQSLVGDMSFYIGDSEQNRALVVFDETQTPDTAKEGMIDVNPGSVVSIDGSVVNPADLPDDIRVDIPAGVDAVIRATAINLQDGAKI